MHGVAVGANAGSNLLADIREMSAGKGSGGSSKSSAKSSEPSGSKSDSSGTESGSQHGSYTIEFESGKKYHGKGPETRMEESAKEKATKYNDPVASKEWKPSANEREAFKDEHARLDGDGGHRSDTNYNRRASPGKKYTEQDK